MSLFEKIPHAEEMVDLSRLPDHVGIIMDGNGRWAKERGYSRLRGHRAGVERLHDIVAATSDLKIPYLTVYAFSTENWKRPQEEVSGLMRLLIEYLHRELAELCANNIRIVFSGEEEHIGPRVREAMATAAQASAPNTGTVLNIAFNYGGRQAIAAAALRLAAKAVSGEVPVAGLTPGLFEAELNPNGLPDFDLIIRTSGEYRLSNFFPFESAYAELVFTPVYWPDFDEREYLKAIAEFQTRSRRFGGVAPA